MHHSRFHIKLIPLAVLSVYCSSTSLAEDTTEENKDDLQVTPQVVVTATRSAQRSFDLPVAIDVVNKENIQDGLPQMTLSESLIRVPGITAQNRSQMAQDPQISTRGFGSRSAFGVRGIRVYVDGIPLSFPDGSGQPGSVDLGVMQGIEVMRGPFSALYGNSSGGVVQLLTENAQAGHELSAGVLFGSYNTRRENARAAGTADGLEYLINYSNYSSDGYRDHSRNKKEQGTAKFRFNLNEYTKLTTLINWFDQEADDPIGLRRDEVRADRKQAPPNALLADTRVSRSQTQVGFNLEHKINKNNSINLISYVGNRKNEQYLSLNHSTGAGRASLIDREFWGTDLRWSNKGSLLGHPYNLSLGLTYGKMNDDRLDIGATNGVKNNNLNRDEENIATNSDKYIQAQWSVLDNLDLNLGARRTKIKLEVDDNFITGANSNGYNSGSVTYEKTTPAVGAVWKVTPAWNIYTNYGKGFDTPTFVEAAYATTALASGPNLGLKPSESRNFEIGTKAFIGSNTIANLTLFRIRTDDEIVTQDNAAGRVTYTNANKTKRDGAEFSISSKFANNISLFGSYTLLSAKFDSTYTERAEHDHRSGNRLPGTYKTQIYGEIAWKHQVSGFNTAFEARHNSKVYVNDVNTDTASSYTIFNIRAGLQQKLENWRFSEYVRVENIFDKDYIGSIRVNDGNARFFEPAAGRNWLLGLNATYIF